MKLANTRASANAVRTERLNSMECLLRSLWASSSNRLGQVVSWRKTLWTRAARHRAMLGIAFAILNPYALAAEPDNKTAPPLDTGIFLVATEQLDNTSFAQTVILITHNTEKGAAGLAINHPSQYRLNELFPQQRELRRHQDEVFLGGPVQSDSIFVLMRTKRQHAGMYQVAKDLYFAAGLDALSHGLKNLGDKELVRAYVGFAGWAPGQLDQEIQRGDWLVVHANPDIIFEQDNGSVWQRLYKTWTGQWI